MGDYKSPGFIGRTFFSADCKSAGTPDGRQEYPVRRFDGFAIRRLKNVPTSLCSGDLQSPAISSGSFVIGGLQIPRFHRSNLFLRRISNPPGRLTGDRISNPTGRHIRHK